MELIRVRGSAAPRQRGIGKINSEAHKSIHYIKLLYIFIYYRYIFQLSPSHFLTATLQQPQHFLKKNNKISYNVFENRNQNVVPLHSQKKDKFCALTREIFFLS